MKPRVVLSSIDVAQRGVELAKEWVVEGLVACVQIVPNVISVYRWKGEMNVDDEVTLVIKFACTDEELDSRLERMRADHPYEEPEFVSVPVDATTDGYGRWLVEVSGSESPRDGHD